MRRIGKVCIAITCWVFLKLADGKPQNSQNSTQCYDCNYAPSGYAGSRSNTTSDATEATEVGYVACALATSDDAHSVAITDCQSNKCFIRLDPNGMVYRGCANPTNLPSDVDSEQQCQYQGDWESLWWFCDGHLCNNGQLGENGSRCGDNSTSTTASSSSGNSDTSSSATSDYSASGSRNMEEHDTTWPNDAGNRERGSTGYVRDERSASAGQMRGGGNSNSNSASSSGQGQPTTPSASGMISSGGQSSNQYSSGGSQQNTDTVDVSPTTSDNSASPRNNFQLTLMLQVKQNSNNNPGDNQDDFHTDKLNDVSQQHGSENDLSGSRNSGNQGNSGSSDSNDNHGNSGNGKNSQGSSGSSNNKQGNSYGNQGNSGKSNGNKGNSGSNGNSNGNGSYGNNGTNSNNESSTGSTDSYHTNSPSQSQTNQDDTIIYALLCDGECRNNPSGLHADPFNETRFIQCGIGVKHDDPHTACTCCHPYVMTCPLHTFFDDVSKVCVTAFTNYYNGTDEGHQA